MAVLRYILLCQTVASWRNLYPWSYHRKNRYLLFLLVVLVVKSKALKYIVDSNIHIYMTF
jgi:hypothetical protein